MSFRAYRGYKDSGIDWLGERPSHWDIKRFKRIFQERGERSLNGVEELLSVSAYTGVSPRRDIIEEGEHLSRAESLEGYKTCGPGDLVMNIMLAWNRGLGFARQDGIVSPAYCVFQVTDGSSARFLDYLLRSNETIRYFKAFSTGVIDSRLRLYPDAFLSLSCGLPPLAEQEAIVAFLDRETGKIDALVEEQRRLIELLKEKRQAVISRAVTKGLDPTAPMKDSGVEWLGDVPAHWSIKPLKRVIVLQRGHDLPSDERRIGDVPIYSSGGLISHHDCASAHGPGIVTGRYGSIGEFTLVEGAFWPLNTALYGVEMFGNMPKFVIRLLENISALFLMNSVKSAVPGVDRNDLNPVPVAVPPFAEQMEISSHLEFALAKLTSLIGEAEAGITLLQERRAALISAAVTGKIDVRGLVSVEAEAA